MSVELWGTWRGAFASIRGQIATKYPSPSDPDAILARIQDRRRGRLTPEEERLIAEAKGKEIVSADRRFLGSGVRIVPARELSAFPRSESAEIRSGFRPVLLRAAEADLISAWDPSIHVEEAVRSMADLDQMLNLLGERLASWGGRDAPELSGGTTLGAGSFIDRILKDEEVSSRGIAELDPDLAGARRNLAQLFRAMTTARRELETAIERMIPRAAPNLAALLGTLLAARLLSKAGGLDRLARLPASTIQVLGAERAFFEHLRGRASPPRHGLLFLHSEIQSAPRRTRGKLARALAGKVAIAARKDRVKSPIDPALAEAFRRRVAELQPKKGRTSPPSAVES